MQRFEGASAERADAFAAASLERLELRGFRNFEKLAWELPEAGVFVVGPNGSGKTNLIEAIYYLEIFRSFRGARDAELLRFGQDVFRIEAGMRGREDRATLSAAYQRSGRRKKVEVDGAEVERLGDVLGSLGAVVFSLDDADLVCGSPGRRRRFLDILLSLVRPGYLASLQRYRAVLAQRNEALRRGNAPVLEAWTEGLVRPGARLMADREEWIRSSEEAFQRYHEEISGGGAGGLAYDPGLRADEEVEQSEADARRARLREEGAGYADHAVGETDEVQESRVEYWSERLRRALNASAERDRRRGVTTVGPHRDDIEIRAQVDGADAQRDVRTFGSGGQQRTAAIALRLIEADTLRDRLERDPIYLLDDVFAELDEERAARVLRLLDEGRSGQVLLTAPKSSDVALRDGGLARWRIREGRLLTDG